MLVRQGVVRSFRPALGLVMGGVLVLAGCSPPTEIDEVADDGPTPALSPIVDPSPLDAPGDDVEAEVVSAYLAFWEAVGAAADPPDPDHPDLEATAADPQLSQLRRILSQYREQGYVRRGEHQRNPVIRAFVDEGRAVVIDDCSELDPEAGLYDAETGELVEGGSEPGDRELLEARLELIDGSWKVVNFNVVDGGSECEPHSS